MEINKKSFQSISKTIFILKMAISLNELTWDDVDEILFSWNANNGTIHLFKDEK